jgi:hypothetical protein
MISDIGSSKEGVAAVVAYTGVTLLLKNSIWSLCATEITSLTYYEILLLI